MKDRNEERFQDLVNAAEHYCDDKTHTDDEYCDLQDLVSAVNRIADRLDSLEQRIKPLLDHASELTSSGFVSSLGHNLNNTDSRASLGLKYELRFEKLESRKLEDIYEPEVFNNTEQTVFVVTGIVP